MTNILLVAPTTGANGGIVSWTKKFIENFSSKDFKIISIDSSIKHRLITENSIIKRMYSGLLDLKNLVRNVKMEINISRIKVMHITTSGNIGTFRDYILCKICRKEHIKTILHCHYGNIQDILNGKGLLKFFVLHTMKMYDEIWVLDTNSEKVLKQYSYLKNKVYILPNCIEVSHSNENASNTFKKVAFVGNLIPTKGLFELIEAVIRTDREISLYIVGHGDEKIKQKILSLCTKYLGTKINILGSMLHEDAVKFISSIDILALPTYYPAEAFPISILEAMSHRKMVISTYRAAIPNMLTALDGSPCGILIEERNSLALQKAIEYCVDNPKEANLICNKAYEKVWNSYRNEVVFNLYMARYKALVN